MKSLSPLALIAYLIFVAAFFYLSTTEVFVVEFGSGVWVFALVLLFLVVVLNLAYIVRAWDTPLAYRLGILSFLSGLVAAAVHLGLKYKPFRNITLSERIGGLLGDDFPDRDFSHLPPTQNAYTAWLPPVIDQGRCGSCWAYAAALVLSSILGEPENAGEHRSCVSQQDVSGWRVSPQALLDLDTVGKCGGSYTAQGLKYASDFGIPDAKCVPGYSSAWQGSQTSCKKGCRSPVSNFCLLSQQSAAEHRVCSDGSVPSKIYSFRGNQVSRIQGGESNIRKVIQNIGPVVAWFSFYKNGKPLWTLQSNDFLGFSSRVSSNFIAMPEDDPNYRIESGTMGHVMVIYGWGEREDGVRYWLVRNSWGDKWGEMKNPGTIKIKRGVNAWNMETQAFTIN